MRSKVRIFLAVMLVAILLCSTNMEPKQEIQNKVTREAAESEKPALVRLEDVSVWYAFQTNGLAVLKSVADYLYSEKVPFHISLIPVFKDPKKGVELSIGDTEDPRVREFNETIRYMVSRGGVVGLHGCTHQHGAEASAVGFEFALSGDLAEPKYAAARIKEAVALAEKAGLPITYWETPHYRAAVEQYREFAKYYRIMYEPDPHNRTTRKIALAKDSFWKEAVCFVPTPLGMVSDGADVRRILRQLDKRPQELASFFFHPFREYQYTRNPDGYVTFHLDKPNGYLKTLVEGIKARGYKFVRVDELVEKVIEEAQNRKKTGLYYLTSLTKTSLPHPQP